jgi:hypothetical protein
LDCVPLWCVGGAAVADDAAPPPSCCRRQGPEPQLEPLSKVHFEAVLDHMVPPSRAAQEAQRRRRARQRGGGRANGGGGGGGGSGMLIPQADVQALAQVIASSLSRGFRGPFAAEHPLDSEGEE